MYLNQGWATPVLEGRVLRPTKQKLISVREVEPQVKVLSTCGIENPA